MTFDLMKLLDAYTSDNVNLSFLTSCTKWNNLRLFSLKLEHVEIWTPCVAILKSTLTLYVFNPISQKPYVV